MHDKNRYRGGRAIAAVLDKLGWLSAIIGIALAGYGAALSPEADLAGRVLAGVPGLVLVLLGLIAVTMAQLTRAAMDGVNALHELIETSQSRTAPRQSISAVPSPARQTGGVAAVPDISKESGETRDGRASVGRLTAAKPAGKPAVKAKGAARDHPIFTAKPPR